MNEIQEYRKATAKELGWNIENISGCKYYTTGRDKDGNRKIWIRVEAWQPNLKENCIQREMVEDWLESQNIGIEMKQWGKGNPWHVMLWEEGCKYEIADATDKSKSTAFMKAFMEYHTNL